MFVPYAPCPMPHAQFYWLLATCPEPVEGLTTGFPVPFPDTRNLTPET